MLNRIKKAAALLAVAGILASTLSLAAFSRPRDCFMVCGPVPFPPGYACWEICR